MVTSAENTSKLYDSPALEAEAVSEAWAFLPGASPHGLPQHSQAGQTNIRQRPPVKWTAPAATVVQERAGPQGQGTALNSFITNIYQVPALDLQLKAVKAINSLQLAQLFQGAESPRKWESARLC